MPLRVLHLLGTARHEGAAPVRVVAALGAASDRARIEHEAWFLGPDGPLRAELEVVGVKTRKIGWHGSSTDPIGCLGFLLALRASRFDILHQHTGGRAPRLLARCSGSVRNLLHLHGYVEEACGSAPFPVNTVWSDRVVAVSQAVADLAAGGAATVVHSGVRLPDTPIARAHDDLSPIIGCAGRLVQVKGIGHLLRAMALLRADIARLRLEIAGDGPELGALRREAEALGIDTAVEFLGWRTDLAACFARWDIFVMPSLAEGQGLAATEAMAAGLPVVASAVGGLCEVVDDGRTGLLVPPGDAPALAAALSRLLASPEQRRSFGMAGAIRARESFSEARMVAAIETLYSRMTDEGA